MRKTILAAVISLMAAFSIVQATPAAAASTTCGNAYYPDGKVAYRACIEWTDLPGTAWRLERAFAWNPTTAHNGHTDYFSPVSVFGASGFLNVIDELSNGETQTIVNSSSNQGSNTVWFRGESSYDDYCYRVFLLPNSGSSDRVANC